MEQSNKHIGELSLREMMENLRSPDGRRVPESQIHGSPAFIAISLNDEKSRRQVITDYTLILSLSILN